MVEERLDRLCASTEWSLLFPDASMSHIDSDILLDFMTQNLGYRHGESILHRHGRTKTKERQAERGRKSARVAVPRGTVVPRAVLLPLLLGDWALSRGSFLPSG